MVIRVCESLPNLCAVSRDSDRTIILEQVHETLDTCDILVVKIRFTQNVRRALDNLPGKPDDKYNKSDSVKDAHYVLLKCTRAWPANLRAEDTVLLGGVLAIRAHDCHEVEVVAGVPHTLQRARLVAVDASQLLREDITYRDKDLLIHKFSFPGLLV